MPSYKNCACGKQIRKTAKQCKSCQSEGTAKKKGEFLERYVDLGTTYAAAKAVGISRFVVDDWCGKDPEFESKYRSAQIDRKEILATMLYGIARGHSKVTSPEQLAAIFGGLKALDHVQYKRDPMYFKEKTQIELSGSGGGSVGVRYEQITISAADLSGAVSVLVGAGACRVDEGNEPIASVDEVHSPQADSNPTGFLAPPQP